MDELGPIEDHPASEAASLASDNAVLEDLLVDDVSIDGMCGVY